MATSQIDGAAVSRYQGRINGTFDLDDETEFFVMGDVVMAVVVLNAKGLGFDDNAKGDRVGTYRFGVRDFALVSDEVLRKNLFHHLPHLEPPDQLPFPPRMAVAITSTVSSNNQDYVELPDTFADVADLESDAQLVDSDTGELFVAGEESRERARVSAANDPILQRFLRSE